MGKKRKPPVTPAIRALRAASIAFEPHLYDYEDKGGTRRSSEELGVDEHAVIKTLVFEDDQRKPLLVLMHGDRAVSARELARQIGARSAQPCDAATAQRYTGYAFGGTSPFGTQRPLPVYVERSIPELPRIWINGGKRGFLVSLDPVPAMELLEAQPVQVARDR